MKQGGFYIVLFASILFLLSVAFSLKQFFSVKSDASIAHNAIEAEAKLKPLMLEKEPEIGLFQNRQKPKNLYPTSEVMFSWDLVPSGNKKEYLYKLHMEDLNKYQFFCLEQVLDHHHLKRTMEKNRNNYDVYLDLHNRAAANALAAELREYDIKSQISTFETEVQYEGNK
jgi:hypothetical protein